MSHADLKVLFDLLPNPWAVSVAVVGVAAVKFAGRLVRTRAQLRVAELYRDKQNVRVRYGTLDIRSGEVPGGTAGCSAGGTPGAATAPAEEAGANPPAERSRP